MPASSNWADSICISTNEPGKRAEISRSTIFRTSAGIGVPISSALTRVEIASNVSRANAPLNRHRFLTCFLLVWGPKVGRISPCNCQTALRVLLTHSSRIEQNVNSLPNNKRFSQSDFSRDTICLSLSTDVVFGCYARRRIPKNARTGK